MKMRSLPLLLTTLTLLAFFPACTPSGGGNATPPSGSGSSFKETKEADRSGQEITPYPFTTCAVIRKELNGKPKYRRVYQGQEVLFCCTPCVKAFDTNPLPYMPRFVAAAEAKARGEAVNSGW